ncbi:hypothetical protein D3C71_1938260 [compost metagenome]
MSSSVQQKAPAPPKVTAWYSRRRHEVQVFNDDSILIFSLQDEDLKKVSQATLEHDEKLWAWVQANYGDVIADLTGGEL